MSRSPFDIGRSLVLFMCALPAGAQHLARLDCISETLPPLTFNATGYQFTFLDVSNPVVSAGSLSARPFHKTLIATSALGSVFLPLFQMKTAGASFDSCIVQINDGQVAIELKSVIVDTLQLSSDTLEKEQSDAGSGPVVRVGMSYGSATFSFGGTIKAQ